MKSIPVLRKCAPNVLIFILSVTLVLVLIEILLPHLSQDRYYVWAPNSEAIFSPDSEAMPGISGESQFSINSEGLRGDTYSQEYDFNILTVGGSTTECLYLDDSESWPRIVQDILTRQANKSVYVGNAGKSGHNTREHYYQVKYLLKQYPETDLIILLIGLNDLHIQLSDTEYSPFDVDNSSQVDKVMKRAFAILPHYEHSDERSFIQSTNIYQLLVKAKSNLMPSKLQDRYQDNNGAWYNDVRRYRATAKRIIDQLPDIKRGLEEYRKNINKIIDTAEEGGVKLLLLTQPVIWKKGITNNLERLLWLGGIGDFINGNADAYYSVAVLAEAMDRYNKELLATCAERRVDCLDLASMLSKDTNIFYDDAHFNEQGARQVANAVAGYIVDSNLLRQNVGNQ